MDNNIKVGDRVTWGIAFEGVYLGTVSDLELEVCASTEVGAVECVEELERLIRCAPDTAVVSADHNIIYGTCARLHDARPIWLVYPKNIRKIEDGDDTEAPLDTVL